MQINRVLARVDRHLLAALVTASAMLWGCTRELASQPSAALGNFEMTNNVLNTNISVDTTRKLTGEAQESFFLGFIPLTSPVHCSVGVAYNPGGGSSFNGGLSGRLARIRDIAAYNAVIGKADILVAPQWSVTTENYFLVTNYRARVSGYPGTIISITNNSFSHLPVSAKQAYEDVQRAKQQPSCSVESRPNAAGSSATATAPVLMAPSEFEGASASDDVSPSRGTVLDQMSVDLPAAERGDLVDYHYTCSLEDGHIVFDSRDKGAPRTRKAGATDTPVGLGPAMIGMRSGEHRRITLPPSQGFGSKGLPSLGIPPNATVVFDIYVQQVTKR